MPGPLPDPNRKRTNAPTIPTTDLPVSGRKGPAPKVPRWCLLGKAGSAWWRWAWSTPQAAAWDAGAVPAVARRASLEDDLAAVADVQSLDLLEVLEAEHLAEVRKIVTRLAGLVSGRLQVLREMRELDDRLGLTPKALAALRYRIVPDRVDDDVEDGGTPPAVASLAARRARLTSAS